MPLCFLCNFFFDQCKLLIIHLKDFHGVPPIFEFRCMNCSQIFQNIYKFKTHIFKHEKDIEKSVLNSQCLATDLSSDGQSALNPEDLSDESSVIKEVINMNNFESTCDIISSDLIAIDINSVKENLLLFLLNLHSHSTVPRKLVLDIQNLTKNLITDPISKHLSTFLDHISEDKKSEFRNIIEFLKNPFSGMHSEYTLFTHIQKLDIYSKPTKFLIDNSLTELNQRGTTVFGNSQTEGCLNDISFQIRKFFETDTILEETLNNIEKLEASDKISNFINGSIWKTKKKNF